ncbi:RNA polymerase sigma factor [Tundrisphaera sp. TA3]|uniref:RNA polymerase sigma factor n=1 Tax=Tundrisphaera sp. TA3 TaxID=3435775 RepID=UPI003EB6E902
MTGSPTGNEADWIQLAVSRFQGPLMRYAVRLVGDAESARDVVQDTFLRLCAQDRSHVEPRLAEWLFTVCRNRSLDVLRKEKRMTRLSDEQTLARPSPDPGPTEVVERQDTVVKILDLMTLLPASQQEVIRLKFQNGFSYQEISRISGHSIGNVGYLIHVGLKTLRGNLADHRATGTPIQA